MDSSKPKYLSSPSSRKRVLCIFYHFAPSAMPGAKRLEAIYEHLSSFGWEPHVITVPVEEHERAYLENRFSGDPRITRVPTREPKRFIAWARRFRIMRLFWTMFYPWFWDKQARWIKEVIPKAKELHETHQFDALITSSWPPTASRIGRKLKNELKLPWVCDNRDPYVGAPISVWPTYFHFLFMRWMERRWLRQADSIVCVTETMKRDLLVLHPDVSAEKIQVIENGYPSTLIEQVLTELQSEEDVFRIVHSGTLRFESPHQPFRKRGCVRYLWDFQHQNYDFRTRSPLLLFQALKQIKNEYPELFQKIRFEVVGWSDPRNFDLAKEMEVESAVDFVGPVSYEDSLKYVARASLLYLPLEKRLDGRPTAFMSTKLYEYAALKRPILMVSNPCEASKFLEEIDGGWVVPFGNVKTVCCLLVGLLQSSVPLPRPRKERIQRYSREILTQEFAEILSSITASPRGGEEKRAHD